MDSLATLELPAIGYGIRYDFGMFEQHIDGGRQVEQHDNWLQLGNAWELPRHEDAQTVQLRRPRRVSTRPRRPPARRRGSTRATVIGLPYDSFIVGHRTDTANTLRLWAARATRDFDLQFFNEGDYRRAVEEKIDTENISKVLYPNDQSDEGKALRLKQQYFFVACSIADIIRRFKQRAQRPSTLFPEKFAIQLNDTHPAIAVAELMRVLIDEEGLDWDAAWAITERDGRATPTTRCCPRRWSAGRSRCSSGCCRATCRSSTRSTSASCGRCSTAGRATTTAWRACRSSKKGRASRCAWPTWRPSARTASTASPSCTRDLIKSQLLPDFHELWPEKFNNKTNGVTPRRWLLHANPRLTRLLTAASARAGSI